jgi:hypothetical protein
MGLSAVDGPSLRAVTYPLVGCLSRRRTVVLRSPIAPSIFLLTCSKLLIVCVVVVDRWDADTDAGGQRASTCRCSRARQCSRCHPTVRDRLPEAGTHASWACGSRRRPRSRRAATEQRRRIVGTEQSGRRNSHYHHAHVPRSDDRYAAGQGGHIPDQARLEFVRHRSYLERQPNVPKSVPKWHENGPRRHLRGPFYLVAGTGFEPATSGL